MRIDTLTYNNIHTQGAQRRVWLRQHSPQHLQQCTALMLQGFQFRHPSASSSTLVLGAGACTEIPLAELARNSDELVLADYDLASMQRGRDELTSSALRKRVSVVPCDLSGEVSAHLNRLIEKQHWNELAQQNAQCIFDAAADSLEQCDIPDPPEIEGLYRGEFGVIISSLVLSQLFSYPLLDMLDTIQRVAPAYLGEQERHRRYQDAAQNFRIRVIQGHVHLLRELLDVGGIAVLLSDVRGFVFEVSGTEHDAHHRQILPIVPRSLPELVRENFHILEEQKWVWITDLPEEGRLGRGYEVIGYILKAEK
ncbi:MAG: hypothetical protein ACXVBU_18110 [Ktedonobacteraceae bacterium]